ncbi:MAG TPA: carboxypeptidase regulatory-like domain-containing protein [Terriglobales bacterium]|nr:carboxypeptidase regulatory-like domain-containing protein [Terriglobales bacterium]
MKTQIRILTVAVLALLLAAPAFSQAVGNLKGAVRDTDGKPMVGAVVTLTNDAGKKYEATTDEKGNYSITGIVAGEYTLTLTQNGVPAFNAKLPIKAANEVQDLDLGKLGGMSAEQRKQAEEIRKKNAEIAKENQKIQGLNQLLAQAKQAEDAGNPQQAVQILTQAAQSDPTRDLLWARLAEAQKKVAATASSATDKKEGFGAAVEDYKKAIAIKPLPGYYNNMGDAMARAGDFQASMQAFEQAATADPANAAMYYYNEGAVMTNAGKTDDAVAAFDKAIKANPQQPEPYYQKGVALLGKATVDPKSGAVKAPPEAAEAFNKYLELAPTGPNAQNAKDMLTSMGAKIETSFGKGKKSK